MQEQDKFCEKCGHKGSDVLKRPVKRTHKKLENRCFKCNLLQKNKEAKFCTNCGGKIVQVEAEDVEWLCPACKNPVDTYAERCLGCGAELEKYPDGEENSVVPGKHVRSVEGVVNRGMQKLSHLFFLSLASLGIYYIFWFHRSWREIEKTTGEKVPGWTPWGFLIPLYNLVLIFRFDNLFRKLSKKAGYQENAVGLLIALVILGLLGRLPDAWWWLGFLSIWPVVEMQKSLNKYFQKIEPSSTARKKYTGGEIALLIIGGVVLFLAFVGTFE